MCHVFKSCVGPLSRGLKKTLSLSELYYKNLLYFYTRFTVMFSKFEWSLQDILHFRRAWILNLAATEY